jgi:hypothetical protein
MDAGYLDRSAEESTVRFAFWMLGGAGLALAEADERDKPRLRREWGFLIRRAMGGLRTR